MKKEKTQVTESHTKYVLHIFKMDHKSKQYIFETCIIFKKGKDSVKEHLKKNKYVKSKEDDRYYKSKGSKNKTLTYMAEIREFPYIKE